MIAHSQKKVTLILFIKNGTMCKNKIPLSSAVTSRSSAVSVISLSVCSYVPIVEWRGQRGSLKPPWRVELKHHHRNGCGTLIRGLFLQALNSSAPIAICFEDFPQQ